MSDTKNFCKQKNSERYRHFSRVYALSESREEGKSQVSSLRLSSSAFAIHISLLLPCDSFGKKGEKRKKIRKKKTAAADQENRRPRPYRPKPSQNLNIRGLTTTQEVHGSPSSNALI